jgi:CHAT domain-containing protein
VWLLDKPSLYKLAINIGSAYLHQPPLALKKKYPNPLYWGTFICQGDPGPLEAMK